MKKTMSEKVEEYRKKTHDRMTRYTLNQIKDGMGGAAYAFYYRHTTYHAKPESLDKWNEWMDNNKPEKAKLGRPRKEIK